MKGRHNIDFSYAIPAFKMEEHKSVRGSITVVRDEIVVDGDSVFFRALNHSIIRLLDLVKRIDVI